MARTARSSSEIKAKKELNDLLPQERKLRMKYRFTNIRTKYINKKIPMTKSTTISRMPSSILFLREQSMQESSRSFMTIKTML
jgi:hypothetical protein